MGIERWEGALCMATSRRHWSEQWMQVSGGVEGCVGGEGRMREGCP